MVCMQKIRKESGVCGQIPRQARASSAVAEISAACSLGAYTIWRPGEEEDDGKGQKQVVVLANKTTRPSCNPGGDPGGPALSALEQNKWVKLPQASATYRVGVRRWLVLERGT